MFSHRDADVVSTFVQISTKAAELTMTPSHYLYVNGKLAVAGSVKVGDVLVGADGSDAVVTAISTIRTEGLFNPHTMDGDIVVNGIKTSTYTSAVAPSLAHAALWPVRMLYALGYDIVNGAFDEGSALIAAIMPNGRKSY
jgi:hypothetical protein